ncbi:MAG TPA: methylmalonyl-CoA epimerase [Dehalococcoidia bacterium]|nr:methylmalonyl-CoA epimerase [Dehalococcoidia bacterium]
MLTKIHHVGVAVRSADDALPFYRDALGLAVTKDAVLDEQGVRGVLLRAGQTEIELLEPLRPDTPVGRFIDSRGEGLHHLCLETDDIKVDVAAAKANSLPLIDERPRPGLAGMIAFLHPKATRGVLVEYAQPPNLSTDRSHQPPSPGAKGTGEVAEPVFDHVAVALSGLEAGVKAFSGNFGLSPSAIRESATLGIRVVSLPIGDAYIGVVAPLGSETPVADFISRRGEGLYLISFVVADLDGTGAALRVAGQRVTAPDGERPLSRPLPFDGRGAGGGARRAFISPRGTNGVLIQLIERAGS